MYIVNSKIYFGELTFADEAGFGTFYPNEMAEMIGSWMELPLWKRESYHDRNYNKKHNPFLTFSS